MTDDTKKRLDEIAARAAAATPGPWTVGAYVAAPMDWTGRCLTTAFNDVGPFIKLADASFTSYARADIPYLLALARDLDAQLAAVKSCPTRAGVGVIVDELKAVKAERDRLREVMKSMRFCPGDENWVLREAVLAAKEGVR